MATKRQAQMRSFLYFMVAMTLACGSVPRAGLDGLPSQDGPDSGIDAGVCSPSVCSSCTATCRAAMDRCSMDCVDHNDAGGWTCDATCNQCTHNCLTVWHACGNSCAATSRCGEASDGGLFVCPAAVPDAGDCARCPECLSINADAGDPRATCIAIGWCGEDCPS